MGKLILNFIILVSILSYSLGIEMDHFLARNKYKLTFLNIGQGDATLIRTPSNCNILIDGGPRLNLSQKIKDHLPILDKTFDLVVITHPHLDHFAGILELQHRYHYKNMWLTGIEYPSLDYKELQDKISSDTEVKYITQPAQYFLCGVLIEVLMPTNSYIGKESDNVNNTSIVLLLTLNETKILITGDAEEEQEEALLKQYSDYLEQTEIKIFKAGHHGSRTSNSDELLKKIQPEFMVISSGESNSYGHPHLETIEKANKLGIQILRTDLLQSDQDITFFF